MDPPFNMISKSVVANHSREHTLCFARALPPLNLYVMIMLYGDTKPLVMIIFYMGTEPLQLIMLYGDSIINFFSANSTPAVPLWGNPAVFVPKFGPNWELYAIIEKIYHNFC